MQNNEFSDDQNCEKSKGLLCALLILMCGLLLQQWMTAEWKWQQAVYHVAAFLAAGIFVWLLRMPWKNKKELPLLRAALLAVYSFSITELLYSDMFLLDHPWSIVWNLLIYAIPYLALYPVFRKRKRHYGYLLGTIWWLIFAMINHYYFEFRAQAFELADLSMAGTAKNVIAQYRLDITPDVLFVYVGFAAIVIALLTERKELLPPKTKGKILASLAVCAAMVILVGCNLPKVNLWNTNIGTRHRGYALSYLSFAKRHLENPVPDGYSAEETEELLETYAETGSEEASSDENENDSETAAGAAASENAALESEDGNAKASESAGDTTDAEERVDVIVIMNEAFSDLPTTYGFETNQDGLPYIHSLEGSNVKKGWLLSSVFGGTTADTEYEFLTGNAIAFLNAEAVPYTQYINSQQESLAWLLKNRGYSAIAFHPYLESGYKRYKVYPYLGFDDFISSEDGLTYRDKIRSYVSDASDYKDLEEIYEEQSENGPVFLFNVTMQNHGSYSTDMPAVKVTVKPTDESLQYSQLEEYLSLAYESDKAFEELTEYFSKVDHKVILLMFGDHQPSLSESVLKALEPEMYEEDASVEEREKKYTVPYIMWANFDLPEEPEALETTSPCYLRSFLLENAGIEGSAYDRFVSEVRKSYPAINVLGYYDAEGNAHELSEAWDEELLAEYRKAGYYNLFDHKKVNWDLFTK